MGVVYTSNGMVREQDSDWLQNALSFIISLFRRYVKVSDNDVTTLSTTVGHAEVVRGLSMHGFGGVIP